MINQQAEIVQPAAKQEVSKAASISHKASDHLANERTFLAWIRTGLATITFGFVVERFGIVVRELNPAVQSMFVLSFHASSLIGVALTALGVVMFVFALINFLRNRHAIDSEEFHSSVAFAVVLAVFSTAIGTLLAVYLLRSA